MTDELDDLKAAMDAVTPQPDPEVRAKHLALAQEEFRAVQENRVAARSIPDRPKQGLIGKGYTMIKTLTTRQALTATTALLALGLLAYAPTLRTTGPSLGGVIARTTDAAAPKRATQPAPDLARRQVAPEVTQSQDMEDMIAEAPPAPAMPGFAAPDTSLRAHPQESTEAFANADPNPLRVTAEEPVSTFSIDVDTASYAMMRSSLSRGVLPPTEAIRIEEMVNYFPYAYPAPAEDGPPFSTTIGVIETPWNTGTKLVHIGLQGRLPALDSRPALNLVFLVDTSGSMDDPAKLPLLKQSFRLMLGQLRPQDEVALVAYAGSAGLVLPPTQAGDRDTILDALDRLDAGGATAGAEGLRLAYRTAREMAGTGEVSRVVLATDGDFNVGLSDPAALERYIAAERESGTYLSVLGFGRGNLDDATMQALAQAGNGQAAYIDTLAEAQKTLVDQLSGALFPIANDVKIQVEFNPARIAEYRLIGYETRLLAREDFNNDKVDAGEIGAGHSVTALYEVTPVGSPARRTDPLRYGAAPADTGAIELGFLKLRFKIPGAQRSQLIEAPILPDAGGNPETGFAVAIAGFGQLLRGDVHLGDWTYADAIALATASRGEDLFGYRTEAVQLMRLAQSLSR